MLDTIQKSTESGSKTVLTTRKKEVSFLVLKNTVLMGSLFPKLPDEIGRECLLRVEFNSHDNLRSVCKSWKAVLNSPKFYPDRKRLKLSEQRICMIQNIGSITEGEFDFRLTVYDPRANTWKRLSSLPETVGNGKGIAINTSFHSLKQKLVVMGGLDPHTLVITNNVCLYDFSSCKWRQGANMPRRLDHFASAIDDQGGLIYVAGGLNKFEDPVRSAAVYKVEEDKWELLPDMGTAMGTCEGAFVEGKFLVTDLFANTIQIFDPRTRTWKILEDRWNSGYIVSAFGRMYCFSSGLGLMEYNCSQNMWNIVGSLPDIVGPFPGYLDAFAANCATVFGDNIFVGAWTRCHCSVLYMFVPPSPTQRAIKWIGIECPPGFQGFIVGAATLDL